MGLFNFLTYRKFRSDIWKGFSPNKRLKLFQKMENIMAKKRKRSAYEVFPRDFGNDTTNGLCDYLNKRIYLNKMFFEEDYLQFIGLATLFHEGRHVEQREIVTSKKTFFKFSKAYKWKKNMQGYIKYDGRDKYSYYSMQEVERDANKFAIERLKSLKFWFRYDDLYYKSLDFKIKQFEDVKDMAKKELGIFYKFKLRKKQKKEIEKNSRNY